MRRAVVLFSGGLDSTTALAKAIKDFGKDNVVAISISYGQKHVKELEAARDVVNYYQVKRLEYDLSSIFAKSNCTLLAGRDDVPEGSYSEQQGLEEGARVSTYVPFRNGLMLSTAASIADGLFPDVDDKVYIVYGAHKDDAAGAAYADCTVTFASLMCKAIEEGTYGRISILAPFIAMTKAEIVKWGHEHKVPYELTWSCYNGREEACGKCGTCIDRLNAFKMNGLEDPIKYEKTN